MTELADDYPRLLARGVPLVDLRSPGEFARGAFPGAVNLPLLTDDERRQVGIRYKQAGSDAAIDLGNRLVSGELKEFRVQAWRDFVGEHPDAMLYCWRGGLRSEIAQAWLADAGLAVPRVAGGYKALRGFCMQTLAREYAWVVLAGRPGSDKTGILGDLTRNVDLEGLANHRGSAFGQRATPQPPPIAFENALAVRLLQLTAEAADAPDTAAEVARSPIAIEDESRTIGRVAVPAAIFEGMQRAPVVMVEAEREARLAQIRAQYVGTDAGARSRLEQGLDNIQRRLGGERHRKVRARMQEAFETGSPEAHQAWIGLLLDWYYDPMYDYQLAQKQDRIVFRGDRIAVTEYLRRATA